MVALLVDKVLRLGIFAAVFLHRDLYGVLVHDAVEQHGRGGGKCCLGECEVDGVSAVVDCELTVKKQLQLLEELGHGPMRERTGEARSVPRIRQSVADKEILIFLLFLPFREVGSVPYLLADLAGDVNKIRLPRAAFAVCIPRIIRLRF